MSSFYPTNPSVDRSQIVLEGIVPVDWDLILSGELPKPEWLAEPLIPLGRQIAIFSPAKAGKSLLAIEIAACLAAGKPLFGYPASDPVSVVYIDQEMGPGDLKERMAALGFSAQELSNLFYYQLQNFHYLDTKGGGQQVLALVRRHGACLVILDTVSRVVAGEEDSSDTIRRFYDHTGRMLKAEGTTLIRLDHAGKDPGRGQRGSSGKNDDVDLVWQLSAKGKVVTLKNTHSRVNWVPAEVTLDRQEGPLRHMPPAGGISAAVAEVVSLLEELRVPAEASLDQACEALKSTGQGRRRDDVRLAMKCRRVTR